MSNECRQSRFAHYLILITYYFFLRAHLNYL
jgi:hypothetical protein